MTVAELHLEDSDELLSVSKVLHCGVSVQVGLGAPVLNTVVCWDLSGGQLIEKMSKSLKHGGLGIGRKDGKLGIGKYGGVGSGTGN